MADDLEERLRALEVAQERRDAELLAHLEREDRTRWNPARTMTSGYAQSTAEKAAGGQGGEGE